MGYVMDEIHIADIRFKCVEDELTMRVPGDVPSFCASMRQTTAYGVGCVIGAC